MKLTTAKKNSNPKKSAYEDELYLLQIELVKLQRHFIKNGERILVIFEGRDGAGKDGSIKRIVEHLSPRETRIVALGKPSDRETSEWYFERYVAELPSKGEFTLFNRSWYNRAGVEHVMGFCTEKEYLEFMKTVNGFEAMLVGSGMKLIKYYLDISKKEQAERLLDRTIDPLKQWKTSPIDQQAQKKWLAYSKARDAMLKKTNNAEAPWTVIRANEKKIARINLIQHLLSTLSYPNKNKKILKFDPQIVVQWPCNSLLLPQLEP
jgi:polyphosphate kinase 2